MYHDKTMGTESAPAGAETDSVPTVPRECGIICDVSVMTAADAPHSIGANCPTCRLSSARPMFNGRAAAGIRDGFLPRQDFTSIPPKPSPCSDRKGQDMARKTNRFEEVRRFVRNKLRPSYGNNCQGPIAKRFNLSAIPLCSRVSSSSRPLGPCRPSPLPGSQ